MEKSLKIADEARNSISSYCINTCKALCCRKGSLILLTETETQTIAGKNIQPLINKKILTKTPAGNFTYNLEKKKCKYLTKSFMCSIHKDEKRPKVCSDYPLFLVKNYIIAADSCPAVNEKLLDKYLDKLEKLGFKRA